MKITMRGGPWRLGIFIVLMTAMVVDLGYVSLGDTSTSLSSWLSYVGIKSPFLAFCAGLAAGHLFPMGVQRCSRCEKLNQEKKDGTET